MTLQKKESQTTSVWSANSQPNTREKW